MTAPPTVTTTETTAEPCYALHFADTIGNGTYLYPTNVCYILVDALLKPALILSITPGCVSVTIQLSPTLFVDKSILAFDHVFISEIPHPVEHSSHDLTPGAHVCVKYKMKGERYYGRVSNIEPIARGVHVQFEDGSEVKFSRETFNQKSKSKGGWFFVTPFVLLCHTYAAAEAHHHLHDATHTIINNPASLETSDAGDAGDAAMGDAIVPFGKTDFPYLDSFQFDARTIDEAIYNSDITNTIFLD